MKFDQVDVASIIAGIVIGVLLSKYAVFKRMKDYTSYIHTIPAFLADIMCCPIRMALFFAVVFYALQYSIKALRDADMIPSQLDDVLPKYSAATYTDELMPVSAYDY